MGIHQISASIREGKKRPCITIMELFFVFFRGDSYTNAAVTIQAAWRGYSCRKTSRLNKKRNQIDIDPALVERVYNSAVKIQVLKFAY